MQTKLGSIKSIEKKLESIKQIKDSCAFSIVRNRALKMSFRCPKICMYLFIVHMYFAQLKNMLKLTSSRVVTKFKYIFKQKYYSSLLNKTNKVRVGSTRSASY